MINKLKPVLILLGAVAISYILWLLGQVQPDPVEDPPAPDVVVQILTPEDFQVTINSTGTTKPLTQTVLNAEVGGEVPRGLFPSDRVDKVDLGRELLLMRHIDARKRCEVSLRRELSSCCRRDAHTHWLW